MVNHYEAAFVLTPVLSEPQTKEAVEKFENLVGLAPTRLPYPR